MEEGSKSAEVGKKVLSGTELSNELDTLMRNQATNQEVIDWVEV